METVLKNYWTALSDAITLTQAALRKVPPAYDYVLGRGLTEDLLTKWSIGYWDPAVTDILLSRGYEVSQLEKFGLGNALHQRITIPLMDLRGKPLAFVARSAPFAEIHPVRYLYPRKDFPYYDQRSHLLGLNFVIRQQPDYVALVEGPIDAILSQSIDVPAVSPHGTRVTQEQGLLLRSVTEHLVVVPDPDDSTGQNLLRRVDKNRRFLPSNISFCRLPPGKDPAELAVDNPLLYLNCLSSRVEL